MAAIEFILGLAIGAGFHWWQQYRFRIQLRKIVNSFSPQADWEISLPPLSLIRRSIYHQESERQKLAEEKNSWQTIMEKAPVGYLQVDRENQLLWCNYQARILLKIDRWREGEVRLLLELIRSYELDCLVETTRKTQKSQEQEWVYYVTRYASSTPSNQVNTNSDKASGQPDRTVNAIALQGYSFPLANQEVGVFIVNRQPLVELSASRDQAVTDLFHELKTPLTSITLVAETLLKRLEDPEQRWVQQMLKETNRLITLVGEWLDLAQLEANPQTLLKYEKIQLINLINSVWETLEPIAQKKQIILEIRGNNPASFSADKSRLIQVFLNLLDNAIKHSPEQGKIILQISQTSVSEKLGSAKNLEQKQYTKPEDTETSRELSQLTIDIIDSGTGFTTSDLPYVFDRLYRGDKSRTRQFMPDKPGGSGLGLAIVNQIIQAHHGLIKAKNHPHLGGAWLQITLPLEKITKN